MRTPVRIVPWSNPFIPALARFLAGLWDRGPENLVVVFPHDRPRRYLRQALAALPGLPRPTLLPSAPAVPDLFESLARELSPAPVRRAQRLDLTGLLHDIVSGLHDGNGGLADKLPLDRAAFLPWGLRLAALLEEFLRQDLEPRDLDYVQDEVEPYAAALLGQLGRIHAAYLEELAAHRWSTPGLDCRIVCADLDAALERLAGKTVVLAGHYALSGAEDRLFRKLWEQGRAEVVWQADPALAQGGPAHWTAAEHAAWMERWGLPAELLEPPAQRPRPVLRFYEGFDRHSQLAALEQELAEAPAGAAVVLPDPAALTPVLHHLPELPLNISMGYPLERTALFQLLETVLALQENRAPEGGFFWRDLIALIRHPYLKMLPVAGSQPLRRLFHDWERDIRQGRTHQDPRLLPRSLDPDLAPEVEAEAQGLVNEILERCLEAFAAPRTLADLAGAVAGLARMLHERGGGLWKRHLLDAECLVRLMKSVVPQLAHSAISRDEYPRDLLFSILRQFCAEERVSFEPEPLTGLQVLGMLETRLLHFDRVYILDAVEDLLPGVPAPDPLLPDPLRRLLALPDSRHRDHVAGYNFHRLLRGAAEVVLLYQSGVGTGVLDGKSVRSRYVEELLWEEERRRGALIKAGNEPPLVAVHFRIAAIPSGVPPIPRDAAIQDRLLARLTSTGLSPSRLDDYLTCPKRFFYRTLTGLKPLQEVDEEGDPLAVGSLVHRVLQEFLTPHVGRTLRLRDLDAELLAASFAKALAESPELAAIPYDRRLALEMTGRHRLERYLEAQDQPTTLVDLEKKLTAGVRAAGLTVPLAGVLDRVDRREGGLVVLDYKTGSGLPRPRSGAFGDEDLFARLAACDPARDPQPELLDELERAVQSLQLPLYLWLCAQQLGEPARDAGWVELGKEGKEILLFGPKAGDEDRELVISRRVPTLTDFLIRHMVGAPEFLARPGRRCDHCDFREPCGA